MALHKVVEIGGRALKFAPLSFSQLDDLKEPLDVLLSGGNISYIRSDCREAILALVMASTKGVTRKWLLENLNVANFNSTMVSVLDANGFIQDPADAPGEAKAAASPT